MSDKIRELLNRIVPRLDAGEPNPIDPKQHHCELVLYQERERIHAEFEEALAKQLAHTAPVAVGQEPVAVEVMRFQLKHQFSGETHTVEFTRAEVADGLEDLLYEKLSPMVCRCNGDADHECGDYIHDFDLVAATPAVEQPAGTTSDQYRAELYDEVWEKARSMGYGNVTEALVALERMQAAEPPDTITIQDAWNAAGGNPGIKATKAELLDALRMLDNVCEEAEQPGTVKVPRETAIALLDDGPRHKTWLAQDELRGLLAGGEA